VGTTLIHLVEWTGGYDETNRLFTIVQKHLKALRR